MKSPARGSEKIFAKHVSVRIFLSGIYKEVSKLKRNNQIRKQAKDMNRHFTKDVKSMKIFSTLVVTREMKIKLTIRY